MKKVIAATTLTAGLVLGGAGASSVAWGAAPAAVHMTADHAAAGLDSQTPAPATTTTDSGDSHPGRWGLAGLTGLLGLFGYRKYKDVRATRGTSTGGADPDGNSSRRD